MATAEPKMYKRFSKLSLRALKTWTMSNDQRVLKANAIIYSMLHRAQKPCTTITSCKFLGCQLTVVSGDSYRITHGAYSIVQNFLSGPLVTSVPAPDAT